MKPIANSTNKAIITSWWIMDISSRHSQTRQSHLMEESRKKNILGWKNSCNS
jgi:hypothetical protein